VQISIAQAFRFKGFQAETQTDLQVRIIQTAD